MLKMQKPDIKDFSLNDRMFLYKNTAYTQDDKTRARCPACNLRFKKGETTISCYASFRVWRTWHTECWFLDLIKDKNLDEFFTSKTEIIEALIKREELKLVNDVVKNL